MNKKIIIIISLITILLIGGGIFLISKTQAPKITGLDDFAKCLTGKNVTMYGAAWCSHCQNTKRTFGSSFQYINYVECPQNAQLCLDKGVNGYPTWILGDGTKLEGEQSLTDLSEKTSCQLQISQ
jgi:glutaredoxin